MGMLGAFTLLSNMVKTMSCIYYDLCFLYYQDGTIIRGQNEISHPTNGLLEPINKVLKTES